ncbi:MAG: DUF1353 domain-containing protein [Verrucomicrobiota bacterium]|nr:DUF1353 domain-containing protein [Verrucomicrobiota bacterium]
MKRALLLIASALCVSCGSGSQKHVWNPAVARQSHPFGYYNTQVEARWDRDGRNMTITKELRYVDPDGVVWVAPVGSVVDGASIPRILWPVLGGPFEGKYRAASVLHDVAYDQHTRSWAQCDRMFYNAMRCSGVGPIEAKTMYFALYRHGHHWREPRVFAGVKGEAESGLPQASPEPLQSAHDWIARHDPSLAEIEARAQKNP